MTASAQPISRLRCARLGKSGGRNNSKDHSEQRGDAAHDKLPGHLFDGNGCAMGRLLNLPAKSGCWHRNEKLSATLIMCPMQRRRTEMADRIDAEAEENFRFRLKRAAERIQSKPTDPGNNRKAQLA